MSCACGSVRLSPDGATLSPGSCRIADPAVLGLAVPGVGAGNRRSKCGIRMILQTNTASHQAPLSTNNIDTSFSIPEQAAAIRRQPSLQVCPLPVCKIRAAARAPASAGHGPRASTLLAGRPLPSGASPQSSWSSRRHWDPSRFGLPRTRTAHQPAASGGRSRCKPLQTRGPNRSAEPNSDYACCGDPGGSVPRRARRRNARTSSAIPNSSA